MQIQIQQEQTEITGRDKAMDGSRHPAAGAALKNGEAPRLCFVTRNHFTGLAPCDSFPGTRVEISWRPFALPLFLAFLQPVWYETDSCTYAAIFGTGANTRRSTSAKPTKFPAQALSRPHPNQEVIPRQKSKL